MEKKGMFLSNRHISLLLSFFILASFFVFISGYFFGKKKAVEKFYSKVDQESLADHVYYSVCSNYGCCDNEDQEQESTEDAQGDKLSDEVSGKLLEGQASEDGKPAGQVKDSQENNNKVNILQASNFQDGKNEISAENKTECVKIQEKEDLQKDQDREQYYAELVGFGSRSAANAFCNKLKKQGITVYIKKRRSRTSRGRNIDWYQAITGRFDSKSDLVAFVDIIRNSENLKGVKIVHS